MSRYAPDQVYSVKRHGKCPNQGFALVIALSLMAFMLLLILAIVSFTEVETANANTSKSVTQARQNALLGLQIAIGETQKTLGPDQRITASSDRWDTDPYDSDDRSLTTGEILETDGIEIGRQHWTGIWNSTTNASGRPETQFRQWLVSGYPESHNASPNDVYSGAPTFDQSVLLYTGHTDIEVGKEDIATGSNIEGRYAYWVGDEGIKAKVNLAPTNTLNDQISAQTTGISSLTDSEWFTQSTDAEIRKLSTPGEYKILEKKYKGSTPDSYTHFNDLTYYGFGLLADSHKGGLKKDLTTALFDTANQPAEQIFNPTNDATPTSADPGGSQWDQLRSWLQTPLNASNELPIQPSSESQAGIYPVVTGFQVYWVPTYDPEDSDGNTPVRLNFMPSVTLWNPYDVPLESATYTITFGRTLMNGGSFDNFVSFWRNWNLYIKTGGTTFYEEMQEQNAPLQLHFTTGTIQPGEALVFSPPTENKSYDFNNPSTTDAVLVRGYNPGYAFYIDTALEWNASQSIREYRWGGSTSRVHALKMSLGTGSNAIPLQVAVYMTDSPAVGLSWASNFEPMYPSPLPSDPMDTLALPNAYGYKLLHTFIENQPVWNTSAANLSPATRKWLTNFNPRAATLGPSPLTFGMPTSWTSDAATLNPSYILSLHRRGTYMDDGFASYDLAENVNVGYSENQSSATHTILFQSAPEREELHSIGQLMHAPLFNDLPLNLNGDPNYANGLEERFRNARFGNLIPAYAIGNSAADPNIELDETERTWNTSGYESIYQFQGTHHDVSYKLNAALWDHYFFSTLPSSTANNTPENTRLIRLTEEGIEPRSDTDQAAADLAINGAFNINSTSVEAWRALLASFYQTDVILNDNSQVSADPANPSSSILRINKPHGGTTLTPSTSDDESYIGYRSLQASEINALAESIVEEVKLRGPFASLAHFINRMPDTDGTFDESTDAFRLKGTLAAALEKADINISLQQNANLEAQNTGITGMQAQAESGWRTENLPGWLSQADLLARLGSTLSARSDTFRVRTYGEAINPVTGETVSARCEAIIQRIPEYVDSLNNPPETPYDAAEASAQGYAPLTQTNLSFGRRFVILDFHWLEDSDV
ncbi:hypothetical protein QEH59_04385 [Coraliomargarita sp. SDUM461004]|uniref:Flp pilus-assembly TadG-like N-terminal domain-containing protein n=1 Tax=Thalassobacterium sedimentorum TaxID=3041258 RepID=A0ABU1AFR0_9BACT|nr:hypothetical protein [Coraliomargarita sp. SDUM461004]MDQ8193647.1 hypothetical protein [Coraliomargarita sp. SDUM461004]